MELHVILKIKEIYASQYIPIHPNICFGMYWDLGSGIWDITSHKLLFYKIIVIIVIIIIIEKIYWSFFIIIVIIEIIEEIYWSFFIIIVIHSDLLMMLKDNLSWLLK
jgi:hypothetical protein